MCDVTTPLIVGGDFAKQGEFPSMAVLGYYESINDEIEWNCGGTLISERYILTAAHCVKKPGRNKLQIVRLGEHNLATTNDNAKHEDYEPESFHIHEKYKILSHYFDIALIRLKHNVNFSSNIRPACLWPYDYVNTTKSIATGWGRTSFGKSYTLKYFIKTLKGH